MVKINYYQKGLVGEAGSQFIRYLPKDLDFIHVTSSSK